MDRARGLLAALERLRTLSLLALADIDTRRLYTSEGVPSTSRWVTDQHIPGLGPAEVTLARRLPRAPAVTDALVAGRLAGKAAARVSRALAVASPFLDRPDGLIDGQPGQAALTAVLVDGITTLLAEQAGGAPTSDPQHTRLRAELTEIANRPHTQRARLEAGLVLFAQRSHPGQLPTGLALLLDALLPAEHDTRAQHTDQAAGLELRRDPLGAGWQLHGRLDDITAELLATVLAAEHATDPANPTDTQAWRQAATNPDLTDLPPADWPTSQPTPRSRAARNLTGLRAALHRLLGTGALGPRDKTLPHLAVTVSLDYLNQLPGALPARATHGSHLTHTQLRYLACDSLITRLVLNLDNRVIQASHTQRTATALERLILRTETGNTCSATSCHHGPHTGHRLIPHHVTPHHTTGRTDLDDTRLLCEQDHHHLHHDRQPLRLKDGRLIGPDGWLDQEPQ